MTTIDSDHKRITRSSEAQGGFSERVGLAPGRERPIGYRARPTSWRRCATYWDLSAKCWQGAAEHGRRPCVKGGVNMATGLQAATGSRTCRRRTLASVFGCHPTRARARLSARSAGVRAERAFCGNRPAPQLPAAGIVVTVGGGLQGRSALTATTVCAVWADPPKPLLRVNRSGQAGRRIRERGNSCGNVLSQGQLWLARRFDGIEGSTHEKRLKNTQWGKRTTGTPQAGSAPCERLSPPAARGREQYSQRVRRRIAAFFLDPRPPASPVPRRPVCLDSSWAAGRLCRRVASELRTVWSVAVHHGRSEPAWRVGLCPRTR